VPKKVVALVKYLGKFRGSWRNGIWAKGDDTACRGLHGEVGIVDWALLCFGFLWQYTTKTDSTGIWKYTVSQKNMPPNFCLYLHQVSTDLKNSFTDVLCDKFALTQLLNIPPHLYCVATLPCEI